jgi:hypothetical protein
MTPKLPASAASKLQSLAQAAADSFALRKAANDRVSELRDHIFRLRNAKIDDPVQFVEIEAAIVAAEARQRERQVAHNAAAQTVSRVQSWLRSLPPGAIVEPVKLRKPTLKKGQTHREAAESAAAVVEQAQSELRALQAAPLPISELKEAAAVYVFGDLAKRGRPKLGVARGDLAVDWSNPESGNRPADDHRAFMAWLDPVAFTARLHAEIDALNLDDSKAVYGADRLVKTRELEQRIEDCERLCEQHTELALAEGVLMLRRRNASPAAILGVTAPSPARTFLVIAA